MLSWLILTGRRFIHEEERQRSKKEWRLCRSVIQFSGNIPWRSGDYSAVVIPVPIPNTEVKHCRGKNSLMVNRARCRVIWKNLFVLPFFCLFNLLFSSCSRRRPIIYRWKTLSVDMTIYITTIRCLSWYRIESIWFNTKFLSLSMERQCCRIPLLTR